MNGVNKRLKITETRRHAVRAKQRSREQLIALAESWLELPVHPIIVAMAADDLYDVLDGSSRIEGLELLGQTEVDVQVVDAIDDDARQQIAFVTAFHREGLTHFDQAMIVIPLRKSKSNKEVAKLLNIDEGFCSKLASLSNCPPEAIEAARAGKLSANNWYSVQKSPDPLATLKLFLSGGKRDQINRKKSDGHKTKGFAFVLPGSHKLKYVAKEATLEDARSALETALGLVNRAIDGGMATKTAIALFKDPNGSAKPRKRAD